MHRFLPGRYVFVASVADAHMHVRQNRKPGRDSEITMSPWPGAVDPVLRGAAWYLAIPHQYKI